MKTIQVEESSPERRLVLTEQPQPAVGKDDVLINVVAAGVNRADLLQRAGKYPPPPGASPILGLEVSGTVSARGEHVKTFVAGERVCALLSGGGYAEQVVVPAAHVMKLPENVTFDQGAGLPEAFITAFVNLCLEGELKAGEKVLIHGGSSGVGTAAIQLGRALGAQVACTVGSEEKAAKCRELGAERCINYKTEDFVAVGKNWSAEGVDLILDCVGGEYLAKDIQLLAPRGRVVLIASMGGATGTVPIPELMKKRARVIGSVLRSRSDDEKARIVTQFSQEILPRFSKGEIEVVLDSVLPLAEAARAHERMASSAHIGKMVLRVRQ